MKGPQEIEKQIILYFDDEFKKWHLIGYPRHFPLDTPIVPDLDFLSDEYFDAVYVAKNFLTGVLEL